MVLKTITIRLAALATAGLLIFAATGVYAQNVLPVAAPRTLSYQGILKSTSTANGTAGNILAGARLLTVTLYGDANGTMQLWQSKISTPVDSNGVFNCTLGSADNPLPTPAAMDRSIWLGVAIDNAPELRPLSQVTASAYAINVADNAITTGKLADTAVTTQKLATGAVQSANLADAAVTTAKLADSSITAEKMNMNYVSSISVNGQPVTGAGTNLNIVAGDGLNAIWVPDQSTLTLSGTGAGGGMKTMSLSDWSLTGNAGTSVPTNFIGTTDAENLWIEVNGTIAMRFIQGGTTPNVVGGDISNVGDNTSGGGDFLGGGSHDTAISDQSSVVGGYKNAIDTFSYNSFIGGGSYNKIYNSTLNSVIGGGIYDTIQEASDWSAIVGGLDNRIDSESYYSFIGGGDSNLIVQTSMWGKNDHNAEYATIAGGHHNAAYDYGTFVGGGESNLAGEEDASVLGGLNDTVLSPQSAIAGGYLNRIGFNEVEGGSQMSFIGAGFKDSIDAAYSSIVGGFKNHIDSLADTSFIGGGASNHIVSGASYSVIGGGVSNIIDDSAKHSFIGGGRQNYIDGPFSVIGGGDSNSIYAYGADHNVISGGLGNIELDPSFGTISGGAYNYLGWNSWNSAVAGGYKDSIFSPDCFLGAGVSDKIDSNCLYTVLGGGALNYIDSSRNSFLGGGWGNYIKGWNSTLVGGDSNTVSAPYAFLGGGLLDTITTSSEYSSIGGGRENSIAGSLIVNSGPRSDTLPGPYNVIAGGDSNKILAAYSTIGGGQYNVISDNADHAAIPGGDSLIANSYAQTVIGYNNLESSNVKKLQAVTGGGAGSPLDDPLLIVGNGTTAANRGNAFEVSYNGHTTVYNERGSCGAIQTGDGGSCSNGGPPLSTDVAPIIGATHQDNIIYAWGDVAPDPNGVGGHSDTSDHNQVNVLSEFGVYRVKRVGTGQYQIWIDLKKPDGGLSNQSFQNGAVPTCGLNNVGDLSFEGDVPFLAASPQVTLIYDGWSELSDGCPGTAVCNMAIPSVTRLWYDTGTNLMTFEVIIQTPDCNLTDRSFTFQVVGRP